MGGPLSIIVDQMKSRPPLLWNATTGKPLDDNRPGPSGEMVWAVAFSPNGRTIVTGGGRFSKGTGRTLPGWGRMPGFDPNAGVGRGNPLEDMRSQTAGLWDVASGKRLGLLSHNRDAILAVAFSPDGGRILTGGADQTAQLWDAKACRPIGKRLVHDGPVVAVAFSPDGRTILTCSQHSAAAGTAQLWNADTGQKIGQPLPHPRPVLAGAFSPDGRTVLTGSGDATSGTGAAHLWSVATGRPLDQPLLHPGPVHSVAWSPDGRHVVTGCADKVARVWEVNAAPAVVRVGHHENVIASSPDGSRILVGAPSPDGQRCDKFSLVETGTRKVVAQLGLAPGTPGRMFPSPDGRKLLLEVGDLHLIDLRNGKQVASFQKPDGLIEAIAISPDGRTVLAGICQSHQKQGEAIFWDAATGKTILTAGNEEAPIRSVAFSPDSRTAAIGTGLPGTEKGEVRLLDVQTGRVRHVLPHQGPVRIVHFSPDGRTVASASEDRTVRLWDVASGKPRGSTLTHAAAVRALAFSSDGAVLLTGSDDHTAQLWNASTGKPVGRRLQHGGAVRGVAISSDGRLLATASDDRTARLWEASTGRPLDDPLIHPGQVVSVAFGADGRSLLTCSLTRNTHGWRMVAGVKEQWAAVDWQTTARIWAVPAPVQGDPQSVLLRTQLATGMVLDAESRLQALDAAAWRDRRQRLGKQADSAPSTAALREWHRRAARGAEAAGEWFAAGWHLERVGKEPADEELHARRGRAYALSQRFRQAVDDLTKTLKPEDVRAELWYFRGLAQSGLGQDDKALDDFSAAIKALSHRVVFLKQPLPSDAWVYYFQRARSYYRLRQWDKAIDDLSLVIRQNPNHGPSWHGRGLAYAEQGDLKRASSDLAAAQQRPDAPAEAWWDLAHARLHSGDVKGYRESCSRALERFGARFGAEPGLAASLAWACSLAAGATADPEQVVLLASGASNGRASYLGQRAEGAALYRAGKFKEAIERFTAALKLREQPAPTVWLFLAMAHQRLNQPEEAKKWLDKANKRIKELRQEKPAQGGEKNALSWNTIPWQERLALPLLQREAERLLQEKPAKP
jgi:WD40 repeat protein/tetratricopeptide (TPR) repeat protein